MVFIHLSNPTGLFGAKTQTTSAFGTPGFGSSTTPAFGGGTTSSGLFGASSSKASLFSQPTTQQSTGDECLKLLINLCVCHRNKMILYFYILQCH